MDNVNPVSKGDELFEAMEEKKKRRKKKIIRTVIIVVTVLAVSLVMGVLILQRQVKSRFASAEGEVQSAQVTRGTISTVVSGSGTLSAVDVEEISVPYGVEVEEVAVKAGKEVKKGDLLVKVNMTSVSSTLTSVQAEIDEIDDEIADAESDTVSSTVKAGVSGRIKKIFAEKGDKVADVMADKGALALISLDGYMAVDIETDKLSVGDSVKVKRADGSRIDGTVETVSGKTATVLVTDNGPKYKEKVTVLDSDGKEIDSGKLYIHNPLSVTGIAGEISSVRVSLNTKVSASTAVFSLTDTEYSADYESLLRERKEKEEDLVALLKIRQDGAVTAPFDGLISGVTYSESEDVQGEAVSLLSLYPGKSMSVTVGVDETDILSLALDQEADITVSSVSEEAFTGKVTEINKTAETSSGVTQYSATVTFEKAEGMLTGMSASVDVKIEGVEDALLIPVEALKQTSSSSYVYTQYDEKTKEYGGRTEVEAGISNNNYVEIKSGLNEGDTVYYTESRSNNMFANMFGGMGGGSMPDFGGGNMPGFGGSGGGGRGERPQMPSGGNFPGFGG